MISAQLLTIFNCSKLDELIAIAQLLMESHGKIESAGRGYWRGLEKAFRELMQPHINKKGTIMKTTAIICILFLSACGGGNGWEQCQPCDDSCEEELIVNTPEMVK